MGTRSLTILQDSWEDHNEIVVMYRQFDGYPDGHGAELAKFLEPITIVDGLSLDADMSVANGGDCLAAQVVAHFKRAPGGIYLHPAGTRGCWEEYIYTVTPSTNDGTINLKVEEIFHSKDDEVLYDGPVGGFGEWLEEQKAAMDA